MFKDNFLKDLPPRSRLPRLLFRTLGRPGPVRVGFLSLFSSRRLTAGLQKSDSAIDAVHAPDVSRVCLRWVCRWEFGTARQVCVVCIVVCFRTGFGVDVCGAGGARSIINRFQTCRSHHFHIAKYNRSTLIELKELNNIIYKICQLREEWPRSWVRTFRERLWPLRRRCTLTLPTPERIETR